MSSFLCEHCKAEILDSPKGYTTSCPHHPLERDPTMNPHPGDKLRFLSRGKPHTREVTGRRGDNIDYRIDASDVIHTCWISTWQEWCRRRKAEVIK